jgi:transposase-like protein
LDYLASCDHSVAQTARAFGLTRVTVYAICRKEREGDLADRPKTPLRQPRRTPMAVEEQVIAAKNRTGLGPKRLARYLDQYENLTISWSMIRHVLRRHRQRLTGPRRFRHRSPARPFVDWYSAKPFEIVQMDLK